MALVLNILASPATRDDGGIEFWLTRNGEPGSQILPPGTAHDMVSLGLLVTGKTEAQLRSTVNLLWKAYYEGT